MKLVDKEKFEKAIEGYGFLSTWGESGILIGKSRVDKALEEATLSPAELAELQLMEAKAKAWDETIPPLRKLQDETQMSIEQLKKQVTDFVWQAKENERKAGKWKDLYFWLGMEAKTRRKVEILNVIYIVDELLAQPEVPPKAKERG